MKKQLKTLLLENEKEIEKKSIFWNMLFSVLTSLQSAIMLLIVTRINGTEEAGILSIAYATSYLMYAIGTYGVRNFQVTDSKKHYSYDDYRKMRWISCSLMIVSSFIYCIIYKHYERYKVTIILSICFLKLLEAIENLYHGELQRMGRLDIAGCSGVIRLCMTYLVFIVVLLITKNLFKAILSMILISFILVVAIRILYDRLFEKKKRKDWKKIVELIKACFPLFVTSFLSIYICNSPKYAIDSYLSETEQAYYAIISMPVFTINLLSGIIYQPKLLYMAKLWNESNRKKFRNMLLKQIQNILGIAVLILLFGFTIGIKMMEVLYGVPLSTLKKEFAILLIGGGMVAIYNFLTACITIMRKQSFLIALSVFMLLFAYRISNPMVCRAGLMGASYLYLILMTCEMLIVFVVLCIYLKSEASI